MDMKLHDKIDITLADLGHKGCITYVFNEGARARLDALLECVAGPSFDTAGVPGWLKEKSAVYSVRPMSPLKIALDYPGLYKDMMQEIENDILRAHVGGPA